MSGVAVVKGGQCGAPEFVWRLAHAEGLLPRFLPCESGFVSGSGGHSHAAMDGAE